MQSSTRWHLLGKFTRPRIYLFLRNTIPTVFQSSSDSGKITLTKLTKVWFIKPICWFINIYWEKKKPKYLRVRPSSPLSSCTYLTSHTRRWSKELGIVGGFPLFLSFPLPLQPFFALPTSGEAGPRGPHAGPHSPCPRLQFGFSCWEAPAGN